MSPEANGPVGLLQDRLYFPAWDSEILGMKPPALLQILVLALCLFPPLVSGAREVAPQFVNRAPGFGFEHVYSGGWEHFVGGGVAVLDCDNDAFPDLFLAGGASPARLLRNTTKSQGEAITYVDATADPVSISGVTGAWPLDFDGDGLADLAVMRVGENRLLRGVGDCVFEDAGLALGFRGGNQWSTAFSATWEPGEALPTLAVGNYVDRTAPRGPFGACDANELHRPDGLGYGDVRKLVPGFCALSMLFTDWNRQGRQDLRISNDRHYYVRGGYEQLWSLDPEPVPFGPEDGWETVSIWGMGIASRDISGDGWPDVYLTSMGDQLLQLRDPVGGRPVWRTVPFAKGATAHRPYEGDDGRPSTGWHAEFGDVDNDGDDDIFVAKGNVDQMPENAMSDPNNLLLQARDGSFVEAGAAAGLASPYRGRGAALADLNLDGRLDVVVVNRRAASEVHENISVGTGNWIVVHVLHPAPNTRMVGGWIEVRTAAGLQIREVTVGGGHGGGQDGPHHFGLGMSDEAQMRLIGPDGAAGDWAPVPANVAIEATYAASAPPALRVLARGSVDP